MLQNVYQFFVEPGLQEVYRDKNTGLPLSSGYIVYFKDNARTEPKYVYKLSGTPSDPIYVTLPNPLPLTSIGTTSDGMGNDIKVYYNPFDIDGNQELYYIEVYDKDGVLQFTREGWPQQQNTSTVSDITFIENFYQDGQFLFHINPPGEGVLVENTTNLSYGGWVFLLPNGFTSTNTVVFEQFPDYVINPTSNPRYSLRFSCVNPNPAEAFKDLVWVNNNVNFLAGVTITVQFEAISNTGFPGNVDLLYEKVFGTGGSPSITTYVTSFTISSVDWNKYTFSFTVSDNFSETISAINDDEIRFILRFPSDVVTDISVVNFVSAEGQYTVLNYPAASVYQATLNAVASSIQAPAYNGSNVGDVLTLGGTTSTSIGKTGTPLASLVWKSSIPTGVRQDYFGTVLPEGGWLWTDGASYDLVGQNTSNEFQRLFSVIQYAGGYGVDTFIPSHPGTAQARMTCSRIGTALSPNAQTSGMTMTITTSGTISVAQVVTIGTIPGASITPGSYFQIFSQTGRSSVYWFTVDGLGSSPESSFPTSLVQVVPVTSLDTADDVALAIVANTNTQLCVPWCNGLFMRIIDNGRGIDPDASTRLDPTFKFVVGDIVGSVEYDALQNHQHYTGQQSGSNSIEDGSGHPVTSQTNTGLINPTLPASRNASISSESRGINMAVNSIIKT